MAKIIDLNEAVGEDIVFKYGDPVVEYAIPGDIDVETVFRLFEMFQSVTKIDGDTPEELTESVERRFTAITGEILAVMQIRQPGLEKYPFGIRATGVILREILGSLGVQVTEDPQEPTRRPRASASRTKKKTASRRKR